MRRRLRRVGAGGTNGWSRLPLTTGGIPSGAPDTCTCRRPCSYLWPFHQGVAFPEALTAAREAQVLPHPESQGYRLSVVFLAPRPVVCAASAPPTEPPGAGAKMAVGVGLVWAVLCNLCVGAKALPRPFML